MKLLEEHRNRRDLIERALELYKIRDGLAASVAQDLYRADGFRQLAEEASELAQAALKYQRAVDGTNPTANTVSECYDALEEEISDVLLCIFVLRLHANIATMEYKARRWLFRLKEGHI